MDWINLAKNMAQWSIFVSLTVNFWIARNFDNSLMMVTSTGFSNLTFFLELYHASVKMS